MKQRPLDLHLHHRIYLLIENMASKLPLLLAPELDMTSVCGKRFRAAPALYSFHLVQVSLKIELEALQVNATQRVMAAPSDAIPGSLHPPACAHTHLTAGVKVLEQPKRCTARSIGSV